MKKVISILVLALTISFSSAQEKMMDKKMDKSNIVETVKLEQIKGKFIQDAITLEEGSYIFEISNKDVGHDVGFVLAPKSNPDAHIKTAYVTKAVANNKTETSKVTVLKKGEYIYFCPLNPTPQYTLIVK